MVAPPAPFAQSPAIVLAIYHGSDNFIVETLAADNSEEELLVNTIGSYQGYVAMNFNASSTVSQIRVQAGGGSWSLQFINPTDAAPFTTSTRGHGDDVIAYQGGVGVAHFTHNGQQNFIVSEYPSLGSGANLLVNEIGAYDGSVPIGAGPEYIVIQADGDWTVTATPN